MDEKAKSAGRLVNGLPLETLQRRIYPKSPDVRGAYYRDTTAIIHSSPFRRLKHKTQVFFAPSNDHICTRIEHVLHVASIAATICRGLALDTELAWAIGMGHDLGHAPFGHVGERILDKMMKDRGFSGFEHEVNSLRTVDFLAEHGKGLNLTYAVRNGIVSHNGEQFSRSIAPEFIEKDLSSLSRRAQATCSTWEAAVVRISDQIAYLGRDYEDACRLSLIDAKTIPSIVAERLGTTNSAIINALVTDVIESSNAQEGICFSPPISEAVLAMRRFNYENIYLSPLLEGYERYFTRLLTLIVDYLQGLLDRYGFEEKAYHTEKNMLAAGFYIHLSEMHEPYLRKDGNLDRIVFDYVAGMSDNFCLDCANEILKPEHLNERIEQSLTGKWFDAP